MSDIERYTVTVKWMVQPDDHGKFALYEVAPRTDTFVVEVKSILHVQQEVLKVLRRREHEAAKIMQIVNCERFKPMTNSEAAKIVLRHLSGEDALLIRDCACGNIYAHRHNYHQIERLTMNGVVEAVDKNSTLAMYRLTDLGREVARQLGHIGGAE